MNNQIIASAVGASLATAGAIQPSSWQDLLWSLLSAVLATGLSWLAGRNNPRA